MFQLCDPRRLSFFRGANHLPLAVQSRAMRSSSPILRPPLLAALAATATAFGGCGKVATLYDAPPPPDAPTSGIIKATVLDIGSNNAPRANVPVVFVNPDGTVAATKMTDIDGHVQATAAINGSVTAIWPNGTKYQVMTIFEAKPGDDLLFGIGTDINAAAGSLMVTFPPIPNATATTSYTIYYPCGHTNGTPATPIKLDLSATCTTDTFNIYVIASDSGMLSYTDVLNVHLADGNVTMSNTWKSFNGSFSAQYTSIPADVTAIHMDWAAGGPPGFFAVAGYTVGADGTPMNGIASMKVGPVPSAGDRAVVQTKITTKLGFQLIGQRIKSTAANYGLDVEKNLMPWMSPPTFDVASKKLSLPLTGGAVQPDVFYGAVQYKHVVGATTYDVEWLMLGPSADKLILPPIPTDAADVLPAATETAMPEQAYELETSDYSTWDEVRPHVLDVLIHSVLVPSQADTYRISYVSPAK
jgi:hypothetical protein